MNRSDQRPAGSGSKSFRTNHPLPDGTFLMRCSVFSLICSRLTLGILLTISVLAVLNPGIERPVLGQQTKRKKPPRPKLPPLKTPADKIRFLEMIRDSLPDRRSASAISFSPEDLDLALERQIGRPQATYAPVISDQTFIRRAFLDLTGELPSAAQIRQFAGNRSPSKRSKLIDQLLQSPKYADHWAEYWQTVIFHDSPANRNKVNPEALQTWFAQQFTRNVPWDRIVAELVSATPKYDKTKREEKNAWAQKTGPNNFVLANDNKPEEIASATARIFMGITIDCAECHDHPFDRWKREQFHELAAFFARGKYYMTDQDDPSKKTLVDARFLLGETPPSTLAPDQRRVAGAAYLIYNPKNYWFARAYVNRVWNELLGDGFYAVDSLGPDAEVQYQLVVNRLAAVFRYQKFDSRWLFRTIMNSRTYQREIGIPEENRPLFTVVRPSRLRPNQIAASVLRLTGTNVNLEKSVKRTFNVNPSIPQADLEGSIQQALLLMNNGMLHSRLRQSELRKQLLTIKDNRQLIEELYLAVLARLPDQAEQERHQTALAKSSMRENYIDDLLWVLINSTEFTTKR